MARIKRVVRHEDDEEDKSISVPVIKDRRGGENGGGPNLGGGRVVPRRAEKAEATWQVRDIPLRYDWVKKSKEDRARRRITNDTIEVGVIPNTWVVWGMPELSDSFESYHVAKDTEGNGNYSCSCQKHAHGDARTFCSHQLAVALWEHEKDPYPRVELPVVVAAEKNSPYTGYYAVPVMIEPNKTVVISLDDSPDCVLDLKKECDDIVRELDQATANAWENCVTGPPLSWTRSLLGALAGNGFTQELVQDLINNITNFDDAEECRDIVAVNGSSDADPSFGPSVNRWYDFDRKLAILEIENPSPQRWGLPVEKFKSIREAQFLGLKEIMRQWHSQKKFIFVNSPTGTGKTAMGIMAGNEVTGFSEGKPLVESLYICTDRNLQDQFWDDFQFCLWSAILKGRRNYATANFPSRYKDENPNHNEWERQEIISCDDCEYSVKKHCSYCDPRNYEHETHDSRNGAPCLGRCPYKQAVKKLISSQVGCINTSYLVRACGSPAWGQFAKKRVLIVDEADCLESTIMGYIEIEMSEWRMKRLGIGRPKRKTVVSAWIEWAEEALDKIGYLLATRLQQGKEPQNRTLFEQDSKLFGNEKLIRRDTKGWSGIAEQLQIMLKSLKSESAPWVYDCEHDEDSKEEVGSVVFKPVVIGAFCEELLWRHFDFVMFMSATIISPIQMADDLGVKFADMGAVDLPSNFDPRRGPIYVCPVVDNSFKERDKNYPKLLAAICKAVDKRPGVRVLIHAVSYQQAEKLHRDIAAHCRGRKVITHQKGVLSKNKAIAEYKIKHDSILISPSMARGVNFYDDLLRFQIIVKMPFGNLGNKQVKQRLYGTPNGRNWYLINVIRETVQMDGRGRRHELDYCETLILDSKFLDVWRDGEMLFPKEFRERCEFIQPEALEWKLDFDFAGQWN